MSGGKRQRIKIVGHKLKFYRAWYQSMPADERIGLTGLWVAERIQLYTEILVGFDRAVGRWTRNVWQ